MSRVKIITDSCCDLPQSILDKYGIEMLPTPVHVGDEVYGDRDDLSPEDFYKILEENPGQVPTTSRITPGEFREKFKQALHQDYQVVSINFSSELSGIFESAVLAKRQLDTDQVRVVDSRSASVGLGLSVVRAARAAREGRSFEEIIELTRYNCNHMEHIFAVGSLDMLKRGGRISRGKAFVGNILNIKPILHFEDGQILPFSRVRGKQRMLEFLVDTLEEKACKPEEQLIGINYSGDSRLAGELKSLIGERLKLNNFFVSEIGAAIGSHVGEGTVSVFFLNEEKTAEVAIV